MNVEDWYYATEPTRILKRALRLNMDLMLPVGELITEEHKERYFKHLLAIVRDGITTYYPEDER